MNVHHSVTQGDSPDLVVVQPSEHDDDQDEEGSNDGCDASWRGGETIEFLLFCRFEYQNFDLLKDFWIPPTSLCFLVLLVKFCTSYYCFTLKVCFCVSCLPSPDLLIAFTCSHLFVLPLLKCLCSLAYCK